MVSPRISPQDPDAAVAGQDDGGLEVALGDDLEQGGGGFGGQGQVAEFVDDQEAGAVEEAHGGGPASFDGGAVAAGGEVGGGGEVGAVAGFGGFAGQADGEVGLAQAGRPDQQDVGGVLQVAAGGQLGDQRGVDGGGGVVVEVLQGGAGWAGTRSGAVRPGGGPGSRSPRWPGAVRVRRSWSGPRRLAGSRTAGSASAASCSFSSARWPRSCW